MSVTPEIRTKFSLQGLREARQGFGRISDSARNALGKVKKSAGEALKPMEKDIAQARRSLRVLGATAAMTGKTGFGTLTKSAEISFRTIKIGSIAAAASVAAIGAAATKAARDSAVQMDKIGQDARRLGASTQDLSVLGFAAEREGVNPEEVTKGIAKIGSEFLKVRQQIASANVEFARFHARAQGDAYFAIQRRDLSGLLGVADGIASARTSSLDGIRQRRAQLEEQLAGLEVFGGPKLDARGRLQRQAEIFHRHKELEELAKAEADLKKSFGPQGEALFGLENYGLDVEKTSKGGVEGLIALGDAIRRVEEPAQRLRYSILLFGEDAGPKLLNLLMSGREGMQKYREEAERLGIVVSETDAKMAEAYEASTTNFKRSIQGLKMSLGRALLPSLTSSTEAMTAFVVKHRDRITKLFEKGLEHLRNFALDVWDMISGTAKAGRFRTEWLNTLAEKIRVVRETWQVFREDVVALANGGDARWPWLDKLGKGILQAVRFAQDLFRIIRGEDAKDFPWLNELRDKFLAFAASVEEWVTWFAQRFREAWDVFISILNKVREYMEPIAAFFKMDVTSFALLVGMLKFTGLLGIATKSVALLGKGLLKLGFSSAFLSSVAYVAQALGAVGIATGLRNMASQAAVGTALGAWGGAGAAAAGGVGAGTAAVAGAGAGAGAARAGSRAARAGALARTVFSRAALPVALVDLGYQSGKGVGQTIWNEGSSRPWAKLNEELAVMDARAIGDASFAQRHNNLMRTDREYYRGYWAKQNVIVQDTADERLAKMHAQFDREGRFDMQGNPVRLNRPSQTIAVRLEAGGKQATGTFPADSATRALVDEISRQQRYGSF